MKCKTEMDIMLNLHEIEQFVLFAKTGSLTRAAELLHISAPTLSRSMQNVEAAFGVSLFHRTKNRLILNATGEMAVTYCSELLSNVSHTMQKVKDYDASQHTICVKSCAPAPLWKLTPILSSLYPSMTIASSICDLDEMQHAITDTACDILILPYQTALLPDACQLQYMQEHLAVCVPKDHALAHKSSVTLQELNGYNFLLRSELGFWDTLCRQNMPASRFLVQTDEYEFNELVAASSLPCFVTDVSLSQNNMPAGRIAVPITDAIVNVTFYIIIKKTDSYASLVQKLTNAVRV